MPLESRATAPGALRAGVSTLPPRHGRFGRAAPREDLGRKGRPAALPAAVPQDVPRAAPVLPIKLRYLVLFVVVALSLRSLGLRALAFWQLHGVATELANYAVCMVGPAGPQLLRERPEEFWRLARRRLLTSPADARPFSACLEPLAALVGGARDERRSAHDAKAGDFREYGVLRGQGSTTFSIADLSVSAERLEALRVAAWPFAPADLAALVRPEQRAKVAPFIGEPPQPARGRGLPAVELGYSVLRASRASWLLTTGEGTHASAYRSEDGGVTWSPARASESGAGSLGGCATADGSVRFRLSHTGEQLRVDSFRDGELVTSFPIAGSDADLSSFACDAGAAVAVLTEGRAPKPLFRLCPQLAACRNLSVPAALRAASSADASLSIARVKGTTVIASARAGVVRVISSRDDGETWTPPVVAFDREEQGGSGRGLPAHLLGLGTRVLLYAGGRGASDVYPVLVSSDFGASWQER